MWNPIAPSNSNNALQTAKSASWAELWLTQRARCATMALQRGLLKSLRSAARSSRAPCISACTVVCAPRARRRKTRGVVRDGAEGGKIGKMAGGRARTARGRKRPRELRRHRRELHHTYERRPRARRRRARRRGPGAGSRRARWLPRRSSQVLLCRGRCIECLSAKIENNSQKAMPMPGARVRAAGAGATPCPRKSVPRSSVHPSFQQYAG